MFMVLTILYCTLKHLLRGWISCYVCVCVCFLQSQHTKNGGSDGKESACSAGDLGLILGLGRSPGGRHGNPLQYSCLEKLMDRGAWRATVHRGAKSQTQLSDYA